MAENDKKSIFPLSGILLILAALGFLQFTEIPFVGSRPEISEIHQPTKKTKARLWQEPFRAVLEFRAKADKTAQTMSNFGRPTLLDTVEKTTDIDNSLEGQIARRAGEGRVTILGVMVFGALYAEETEDRLRRRYAVLTGLGKKDYVPDDPEHIDYIRLDYGGGGISMTNIMPFEWFTKSSGMDDENGRDSVLVLWLNDDIFSGKPLAKLASLADRLELKKSGGFKANISFKILGPAGSTRLQQMVAELEGFDGRLQGLEIYSATATMDDSLLLASVARSGKTEFADKNAAGREVVDRFKARGITFTRTIASDRSLAEKLTSELLLRRVVPDEANDYIMLVAEWDTLYARSLLSIYETVFSESGIPRDRLIHFSYMRGIDGSLPGKKEETQGRSAKPASTDTTVVKQLERPLGESQYDYLRRLASEAYEIEQLQLQPHGGSIRAIGVLGSDFYDKYLVLQALRQKFPAVIFFTTDLDARLLHPDNLKWTRNLVVASSFGLTWLDGERSDVDRGHRPKNIPLSFRSNYQTSLLAATLQALLPGSSEHSNGAYSFDRQPRIFEIGRHSAVELSNARAGLTEDSLLMGCKIVGIALAVFFLLYFSSHTVKAALKTTIRGRMYLAGSIFALLILFVGWMFYIIHMPGEEPFSWDEGLSIWPAEILRVTAVFLSLYYLLYSSARLKKNAAHIAEDFAFDQSLDSPAEDGNASIPETTPGNNVLMRIRGFANQFCDTVDYNWDGVVDSNASDMAELWQIYLRRDSMRYRIIRLIPIIFFYVALCVLIFLAFKKPVAPVRGTLSWGADKMALIFSVGFFIVLNFYVFDVTRTFRRFIDLAGKMTQWPEASVQRFCSKHTGQVDEALKEWMLIRLIAIRSDALGKLIFYPFVIWFILFVARVNYFDNWHLPIGLSIIITLGAVYVWSSAFVLRRSAERARGTAVQRLNRQMAGTLAENPAGADQVRQIEFVLKEVKSTQQGAFAPFSQHPVLQALLIPFGGVGGLYLFDFLTKLNI